MSQESLFEQDAQEDSQGLQIIDRGLFESVYLFEGQTLTQSPSLRYF
jgi:hypothetical protein